MKTVLLSCFFDYLRFATFMRLMARASFAFAVSRARSSFAVRMASSARSFARSARSWSIASANSKVMAARVTDPPLTVRNPPEAEAYLKERINLLGN